MNFKDKCYLIFSISIIIYILTLSIIPLLLNVFLSFKASVIYTIIMNIFVFVILFLIPIYNDGIREENFTNNEKIKDGTWVHVYKTEDPNFYKKKWKNVHEFIPISKQLGLNFLGDKRSVYDLIAWYFCMGAQWENILYMEKYNGKIDSVPYIKNIDEKTLSFDQEVCRIPTPEDSIKIKKQFKKINDQLKENGMYYVDIHSGNVMIDENGNVKFTDGEMLNFINYIIASIAYIFVVKCPFKQVDNNNRIYWSNENMNRRPPIDSIDHTGKIISNPY
jgi:hypothetical protein